MKRVLIFSSYPIDNPVSGGQKRAAALVSAYKKSGDEVRFVSVYHPAAYEERGKDHILLAEEKYLNEFYDAPYASDIIAGEAIDRDVHVRSAVAEIILSFRPHAIQFEQVFVAAGLMRLLEDMGLKPIIVLSSHNIEYEMKKNIYENLGQNDKKAMSYLAKLKSTEEKASKFANLVVAVSQSDVTAHISLGARRTVLVPNGINRASSTSLSTNRIRNIFAEEGIAKKILFVGSLHPPNWQGFEQYIGYDLSFLPKGAAIVVVGSVSRHFEENRKFKPKSAAKLFGIVDESTLGALVKESDVIVLPISSGGGSNLKTAEAISSGKLIVATDFALRGFDKYRYLPTIRVASTAEDFRNKIITALDDSAHLTGKSLKLARTVEWKYITQPMVNSVNRLIVYNLVNSIAMNQYRRLRHYLAKIIRRK